MNVGIICQMNQVRSPFAESVLKNFFPENQFFSAGITAHPHTTPEPLANQIAEKWKLGRLKTTSENLYALTEEILRCDFVITAESNMKSVVRELGYRGEIFDFQTIINEKSFVPSDPIGLPLDELTQEIAKVAYCATRIFRIAVNHTNLNPVKIYIPTREKDSADAYLGAIFSNDHNPGVVIDVDFRSPGALHLIGDYEVVGLESIEELIKIKECRNVIYSQKWESSDPEAILLSNLFKRVLRELSNRFPVYLIAAPRFTHQDIIPDSYLAALWADSITIISS